MCQRNVDSYYRFIEIERPKIQQVVVDFFKKEVKDKFPLDNCNSPAEFVDIWFSCHGRVCGTQL